jgi:hypothetical protein
MTANKTTLTLNVIPMFVELALMAIAGILFLLLSQLQVDLFSAEKSAADTSSFIEYQLKPLAPHANKHAECQEVWERLSQMDTRFCRYECKGRMYYACNIDGKWAFAVEDTTNTITAFFTTQDYAVGHTRDNQDCKPFMSGAHP